MNQTLIHSLLITYTYSDVYIFIEEVMEATKSTSHYPQAALIKHGRVRKKIKYNVIKPYSDRYLYLTQTSLLYYHIDSNTKDENNADCRIPLSAISDISLQSGNCVTDSQEVEIVIDSGTFATKLVFQCPGDREGMKWVQQIKKTREEYLASRWSESASVTWKRHSLNKRIVGTAEGMFRKLSKFTSSTSTELLTQDQIQALIR